jgi:CubicO group peptidase (beta-lactamase class C family)
VAPPRKTSGGAPPGTTDEADPATLLSSAEQSGVAPSLRAAIIRRGERVLLPTGADDLLFDLASLTKPLCTGLCTLGLVARGEIALGRSVQTYLPDLTGKNGSPTVQQLLDHSAGLPAWRPLFRRVLDDAEGKALFDETADAEARLRGFRAGRKLVLADALAQPLEEVPGKRALYSDLGFLWLTELLERVSGLPLDNLYADLVMKACGARRPRFFNLARGEAPDLPCAPTGSLRPRPPAEGQEESGVGPAVEVGLRPGEVDDDNAYASGGVAGHAGLFGTASDAAEIGQLFLEEYLGARRLAEPELVRQFAGPSGPGRRGLSWDRPTRKGSSIGTRLGRGRLGAVGHLGYTGCSLWIDLDRELVVALLSNRVFPDRQNQTIRAFRPRFHDAVAQAL